MGTAVIKINGAVWTLVNRETYSIQRGATTARLIWKGKNSGKLIQRNVQTGRFMSSNFVAG